MKNKSILSRGAISVILFITALLIRIAYLATLEIDSPIRADALKYFTLASNLIFNDTYSLSTHEPFLNTTYITPGYPLFLALFLSLTTNFATFYWAVLITQAVLGASATVLVYLLACRFVPVALAAVGGILVAISPHLTVFSGYMLTETLFIFFLILSILSLVFAHEKQSLSLFVVSGALLAASSLVRPAYALFIVIIIWTLLRLNDFPPKKKAVIALLAGFIAIMSPWQLWKMQSYPDKEPSLLAAAMALGGYPDLIFKDPQLRGFPYREDPEYNEMIRSPKNAASIVYKRAKKEPGKYLTWYLWGKAIVFSQPSIIVGQGGPFVYPVKSSLYHKNRLAGYFLYVMFFLHPFIVFGAVLCSATLVFRLCFSKAIRNESIAAYIVAAVVIYFTGIHIITAPLPRYAIPLYPLIFILFMRFIWQIMKYVTHLISIMNAGNPQRTHKGFWWIYGKKDITEKNDV